MYYAGLERDFRFKEYECFDLLGAGLIGTKSEDGEIIIARNSCRHRGFKIGAGCGKLPLYCPYHGQRFDFDRKMETKNYGGFVFVGKNIFEPNIPDLLQIGADLGEEMGSYQQKVKCRFHLWMQNTADPNHLRTIHANTFCKLFKDFRPYDVVIDKNWSSYKMTLKASVKDSYSRYSGESSDVFQHWLIYPCLSITKFMNVFYSVESAIPLPDKTCEVTTRFFLNKNVTTMSERVQDFVCRENIKILEEDRRAMENWEPTYDRHLTTSWLPGEERVRHYVEYMER